ncbi:MAG: polysaccharide biosynthesis protein [Candidatus Glassbacteria bacterium]|nr:polysaccharide biosynthesis protein [Candidatus Glassbacteria bacterium]
MDFNGKSVLVTGGTGSFGQRCCEALYQRFKLKKLIIFSRDESKQFEMMPRFRHNRTRFMIGDVRDKARLLDAVEGVDLIIHAAALKQVPQAEYNPFEYVKTNILGTQNVIEVARAAGVSRVIHTSTDKAVNPLNHYGATKLCADKLLIAANYYLDKPRFACVRMGNLIGSRGSVIPVLRRMSKTGKVTVTDPLMTRFWLTLDDAVDFVLARLADMRGGEVFVPLSPTMKMTEVMEAVAPGCKVEVAGRRPGEKIDEILVSRHEACQTVRFKDHFAVLPDYADVKKYLAETGAVPVGADYEYTSVDTSNRLSVGKLRKIIKREGI